MLTYVCDWKVLNCNFLFSWSQGKSTYKFIEYFRREEVDVVRKFNCSVKKFLEGKLAIDRSIGADWQRGHSFLCQKHVGHQKGHQQQTCSSLQHSEMGSHWLAGVFGSSSQSQMLGDFGCAVTWLRVPPVLAAEQQWRTDTLWFHNSFILPPLCHPDVMAEFEETRCSLLLHCAVVNSVFWSLLLHVWIYNRAINRRKIKSNFFTVKI